MGRAVLRSIGTIFRPAEVTAFKSMFLAKHAIADEIERLMVVLDALDGDDDLEMNAANYYDDPRLDDAEA